MTAISLLCRTSHFHLKYLLYDKEFHFKISSTTYLIMFSFENRNAFVLSFLFLQDTKISLYHSI